MNVDEKNSVEEDRRTDGREQLTGIRVVNVCVGVVDGGINGII